MQKRLLDVTTEQDFEQALRASENVVAHFWAPWCEPCKQLDAVLAHLMEDHQVSIVRVEAEEATELSIKYSITVVPSILLFKAGSAVDRLEGADIPALREKVGKLSPASHKKANQGANGTTDTPPAASPGVQKGLDDMDRVKQIISSQRVVLLMKGTPDAPRCGFSSRVVAILRSARAQFRHFDILSDQGIRQAAKVYSDWPSYPQLYIDGNLVGGCDIVEEMQASGDLAGLLQSKPSDITNGGASLEDRLKQLTTQADVVLFMKGSPEAPQCGFSAKVVQALRSPSVNTPFKSFDILQDQEVREGLKKFSQWPTYPQLYAGGELLGGCDIILELLSQGQLKSEIESQIQDSKAQ